MKKRVFLIVLLLIIVWAGRIVAANKVVLFIVDGVSWQEWQKVEAPHLRQLMSEGAVGLMNAKTADHLEPVDTYLTIASGDRACGSSVGKHSFNRYEKWQNSAVEDIYHRRIGQLDDSAAIVNLSLAQLKRANRYSSYQAQVGNLGTVLARHNLKIAVLGNADTGSSYRRQVALLGINKYGVIKQGDIGHQSNLLVSRYPSLYLTNKSYIVAKFKEYLNNNDLIIVESGTTSRIEAVKNKLLPDRFSQAKEKSITRVDKLLGEIKAELDLTKNYLIVLVPTPAKKYMQQGYKLSWTLVAGPNIKAGLLSSGTTKQLGLMTNLDILPSIYNYLLTEPQLQFTGQPIITTATANKIHYLNRLEQKIQTIFSWRPLVVKEFIALQIIILVLVALSLIFKSRRQIVQNFLLYTILLINWLPLFFLFSKFFTHFSLFFTHLLWISGSLIGVSLSFKLFSKKSLLAIILPNILTAGILIIDLWSGGNLLKVSILGYSPVIGARYYGLGNEYMGLLIGITIVLLTLFFELRKKVNNKILIGVSLILIVTIAAPDLGANFGGLLASVFTVLLSYYYLNDCSFKLKTIIKIFCGGAIIIFSILVFDLSTGAKSHFTRLFLQLQQSGLGVLVTVIKRKLAINLRLLEWTIWTKVLLAFVFILVVLFKHPRGLTAKLISEYPYFTAGFKALLWGSLAAGVVNDSGVVVVATLLLVPVFTLVYLVLLQIYFPKEGNKYLMYNNVKGEVGD
ncbi:hypothetical protein [Halanaerobacter jeridensis]|uniref:Uncharacterized protein n=1 Tax=Halanaerobacter jeridensis TaxID=706427 RepID=A0A938XSJ7_9FIRM|nr:hypothetical protein [Halanaerobacter jeridensis]MBM7556054.1 hypothetical protein [Halanaerobacter jeridensis]